MMCFRMKRNNEQQTVKTFTQHALSSFPPPPPCQNRVNAALRKHFVITRRYGFHGGLTNEEG